MNKKERVDAVLSGETVDRPPFSFWYHFGDQFLSGEQHAATTLEFFRYFDLDFLKVMNDYHLQPPDDLESVRTGPTLLRVEHVDPERSLFNEQLKAIRVLYGELHDSAYLIDTVFDPWQQLTKHLVGEYMLHVVKEYPSELKAALDIMTDNVIEYCKLSLKYGSAGIFLAVPGSEGSAGSKRIFEEFIHPCVVKVLEAIKGLGKMNAIHLCGAPIITDHISDYPADVISWADRAAGNPTIDEMKVLFDGVVMGGIDHTALNRYTWESIKENVRTGIQRGGISRFILAPGCSAPCEMDAVVFSKMGEYATGKR